MTMLEPFADLARVRNLIDRAFEETAAAKTQATRAWRPPVDLFEDENAFTLQLELPGVDRDKIEVEVTHEELVIRGEPYKLAAGEHITVTKAGQYRPAVPSPA